MSDYQSNTLYRMFDSNGRLLYVGITAHPPARFRSHQEQKYWWERVTQITVQNFDSRAELEEAERVAIVTETPFYNVTHNGKRYANAPAAKDANGKTGREMNFFLAEVSEMWRLHEQMKEPVRYITRQIVAGKFRARRVGRHWMMTAADIEYNLDRLANVTAQDDSAAEPAEPTVGVPSLSSLRRRRSA